MKPLNCHQCRHFKISWDPKAPYACGLYQIKSSLMPSQIVKAAGAGDCQGFEAKVLKSKDKSSRSEASSGS